MSKYILGISAYYHDSAAVLLKNGDISAAVQEERFTRKKHDPSFPRNAVEYVLKDAGITLDEISTVAFYDKPLLKFERLLETYHAFAPRGLVSFLASGPVWIKEKVYLRKILEKELSTIASGKPGEIVFPEHHLSHAGSAFFASPFENAAILTIDGVGEWATTTIGHGKKNKIEILRQLDFPHSLGLLYSAFTYFCGFKVNSGEYKMMGLAPYGNQASDQVKHWVDIIYQELIDLRDDGSFLLNMEYFNFATGLSMVKEKKWEKLFGIQKREMESSLNKKYMNLALAIQQVTEEVVIRLAKTAKDLTGAEFLVMAGGVALNCVANGKLLKRNMFKQIWVQPAAGDAGGALGAALATWHIGFDKERKTSSDVDMMKGAYLGPEYSDIDIKRVVKKYDAPFKEFSDFNALCVQVAELLNQGNVIGWFQGRMEFGPRALGNRSILGDPRHPEMQKKLNVKIKFREGFRPFAPAVLEEKTRDFFDLPCPSPYMLLVAPVKKSRRSPLPEGYEKMELYERLYHQRSDLPAITHVDYSARIQTVNRKTNPKFWRLIKTFGEKTGYGILVNTSFNVRGEPIVCKPMDAYACFMRTEMDYLVMNGFLFDKKLQPRFRENLNWKDLYELD